MKKKNFTILLVEDDANDQFLIQAAFRKIGVTDAIQVVGDGEQALAYLEGEGKYADRATYQYPTFILMDLKMPKMDGFAVLAHLKQNPNWRIIPTVIFSASCDLDDIKQTYALGASSYHIKPAGPEEMRVQLKLLYDYWMTCEIPQVDASGKQLDTISHGKMSERFAEIAKEK
jgi:CheY-like chemotaxis protein